VAQVTLERLQEIPLARKMTEDQVKILLPRVEERLLAKGETLFLRGEPLSYLYYVEKGRVREEEAGPPDQKAAPRYAGPGEYLGRYALVTGQPPRVTASAEEDTTLLAIPLRDVQPILFAASDWRSWFFNADVAARLRAIPLFKILDDWDLYTLADQVEIHEFAAGEPIYHSGDEADSLYLIDRGQVMENVPGGGGMAGKWPRHLAAGNFLGRTTLKPDELRESTAIARMPSRLFCIPIEALQNLFRARNVDLSRELPRVDIVGRLRRVHLFSTLKEQQLRLLAGYVSVVYRRPGDTVSRQGEPASGLLILDEGEAIVRRQIGQARPRPVGYLKVGSVGGQASGQAGRQESIYFGDHALLGEEIRGATVEVTKPSTWIVLDRNDFHLFLGDAGLSLMDLKEAARQDGQMTVPHVADIDRLELPFRTLRHWIVPVTYVLPLAFVVAVVGIVLAADVLLVGLPALLRSALFWMGAVLLAVLIPWTVWRYVNWRNDQFEVTNEAVIHLERVPFPFPRENRYEVPLVQIQNVTIDVSVLGQLLGYGDLSLDTAAIQGEVMFTSIPEPARVQKLIQRAAAEARSGREIQFRESIRQQLEDELYPERLKPAAPPSATIPPGPPSQAPRQPGVPARSIWGFLPWIEKREDGLVTWRKHWINMVRRVGLPALAFLAASYLLMTYILFFLSQTLFQGSSPIRLPPMTWLGLSGGFFFFLLLLWILAALWVVYQYVDYWNDVYIVTDDQVIDVQRNLAIYPLWFIFTESRRQASLDKVQNVNLQIPNLVASVLGYGDVIVQTAGTEGTLDFLFVNHPRQVQAEVLRRVTAHREREREEKFQQRWGGMAEWFEAYKTLTDAERAERGTGGPPPGAP
jgi:CRP-like cAMP-binding protein/uncharacterized membrane protein YdbT with pleckstrin-like domain